jgi:hypothetical protein
MEGSGKDDREPPRPVASDTDVKQWVAYGMLSLAVYLEKQAAFEEYCRRREHRLRRVR